MKTKMRFLNCMLAAMCLISVKALAFYDPGVQRWVNRDPIQEEGGVNLYQVVNNSPVSKYDLWGLKELPLDPKKDPPRTPHPGTETPRVFPGGGPNPAAYNCHSYAWHGGNGDPTGDKESKLPGYPKWDNSASNEMQKAKKLDPKDPNKVGDVVVYGDDKNKDGKLQKDEVKHSGFVQSVDADGNTTRVSSKEGEGTITDHHPADPNPDYGNCREYYRP